MRQELKYDDKLPVFSLNKEELVFKINKKVFNGESIEENVNRKNNLKEVSHNDIIVSNLTDQYLAFRTKTTKKVNYSVDPTYCIIEPNSTKQILFTLFLNTSEKPNPSGHKFRFEGFEINQNQRLDDPKKLFNDYLKLGEPVRGNISKKGVKFEEEIPEEISEKITEEIENVKVENNTTDIPAVPSIINEDNKTVLTQSVYTVPGSEENQKSAIQLNLKGGTKIIKERNEQQEKKEEIKLNELITENNKLKEEKEKLLEKKKNIEEKIAEEIKPPKPIKQEIKLEIPKIESNKVSYIKIGIIFFTSILIAFYLTK